MGNSTCSVDGCERPSRCRGWCGTHYGRWRVHGDVQADKPIVTKKPRGEKLCKVDGCDRLFIARGWCSAHYARWRRYGDPQGEREIEPKASKGSGSTYKGYRRVQVDGEHIYEHRAVMEEMIGRPLRDGENVHHVNGRRADNRPENLELWVTGQPPGQRVEDLVVWVVEQYPEYVEAALDDRPQLRIVR